MRSALIALGLGLALAWPAHARTADELYAAGAFSAAADVGEREPGVAGKLIAARALLAMAINDFRGPQASAWLDRAQRNSEAALAAAPDSATARLQIATALGMKGRRLPAKAAANAGYARRGKLLIDEALRLAPEEPWAYALLGGWNLEVVRRGGPVGSVLMGASARAGVRAFDRARALAPADPVIAFHYAIALLSLDAERYESKAKALLAAASEAAPRNAFEANVRDDARGLLAVVASKGALAAAKSAADYL